MIRTLKGGAFFAAAAEAMRRILVDRARARLALKRGGERRRIDVEWNDLASRFSDSELIETECLLDALAAVDSQAAEIARLHVFGGFPLADVASILGISRATAYRDWAFARAWLRDALDRLDEHDLARQMLRRVTEQEKDAAWFDAELLQEAKKWIDPPAAEAVK